MHAGGLRFFFEMLIFESAEATNAVIERHQCFPCHRPSDHKANFARVSPQNCVHRQPAQSLLPALLTASLPLFPPPYNCNHTTTQRPKASPHQRVPRAHCPRIFHRYPGTPFCEVSFSAQACLQLQPINRQRVSPGMADRLSDHDFTISGWRPCLFYQSLQAQV
jgi:hypothetical protein